MWQERCESLVQLCESAAWSVDSEAAYQRIADVGTSLFGSDGSYLHLLTLEGDWFVRHAFHSSDLPLEHEDMFSIDVGRARWMMRARQPIVMNYLHPHSEDVIPASAVELGCKSAVSIPLLLGKDVLGLYSLVYKRDLPWMREDTPYLLEIGRVLGVLVQRIQMTKKESELQVLNERKRLSTEIHDNISQLISSLAVSADTALLSYEEGDEEAVCSDLERLGETTRRIMKVLREEMLSLRTPLDRTDGLLEGIKDRLARFEDQWGIGTILDVGTAEPVVVSLQVSLQLVRILNECLQNTLRHAEASWVHVKLEEDDRYLTLEVQDDGCGFDPAAVPPERLGIRIMHERATAAGGRLTIASNDRGTTVRVDVPCSAL